MSRQRSFSGGLKSVAAGFSLLRQRWLLGCRDKVVGVAIGKWYGGTESYRDRNFFVATKLVVWYHDLGSLVTTEPGELGGVATECAPNT